MKDDIHQILISVPTSIRFGNTYTYDLAPTWLFVNGAHSIYVAAPIRFRKYFWGTRCF